MRSLRPYISAPDRHNLRINTICPWMTQTRTTVGKNLENRWAEEGLPISTPLDVAKVAAGV